MKLARRTLLGLAAGAAASPMLSRIEGARAQDYPSKPVRIITHSAAGGAPDALLRIVADRLTQRWGQQVVTLNQAFIQTEQRTWKPVLDEIARNP
jgi:tripartite-type tricarboxylate transporter receptor subunit TctC